MSDRKRQAVFNTSSSMATQAVIILFSFLLRKQLIQILGIEIVGVNGVLSEMVSMLSLAELGIATSIIYRLYQPVAKQNELEICRYFAFFRRAYHVIGMIVLFAGSLLCPFLEYIIRVESMDRYEVMIAYIMLIAGFAVSFFFSHYRTMFVVYQRQYYCNMTDAAVNIVFSILKLFAVYACKSFLLYISIQAIQGVASNLLIRFLCYRSYPFIRNKPKMDKMEYRLIFKDVKNVAISRFAGYVYSSTDNLIISSISGAAAAGFISNYKCVFNPIRGMINMMNNALVPTWGAYVSQESKDSVYSLFLKYNFVQYVLATVILVPTWSLIDKFIVFWIGKEFLISKTISLLMVWDIFINALQEPNVTIMNVTGRFRENKIISEIATVFNIIVSILLALFYDVSGVLWGTIVALMLFWIGRSYCVYNQFFQKGTSEYYVYWRRNVWYMSIFAAELCLMNLVGHLLQGIPFWGGFFLEGTISIVVMVLINTIMFGRTEEFVYVLNLLQKSYISLIKRKADRKWHDNY